MAASTLNLPAEGRQDVGQGHGTDALGPSDSSDSGSDLQGVGGGAAHRPGGITPTGRAIGDADLDSDSDAQGTGERAMAGRDSDVPDDHDIGVDRVVGADEASLGGGLDQAEEAWTGRLDDDGDALASERGAATDDEAVDLRSGRDVDDISAQGERTEAADAAVAGGVDEDELLDQLHSGSDSESSVDSDMPRAPQGKTGRGGAR
jgi:hypothetical protein